MTGSSNGKPTLTENLDSWKGSSILSVTQISPLGLQRLFTIAQQMRDLVRSKGGDDRLAHRVMASVFFEASTRTSCSFQVAMMRLGGKTIHVDGLGNSSAGKKGESLDDTIRCLECYTDVTVLRHPLQGSVGNVIAMAEKPVLNAGDGVGEHPTQALLDAYTIIDELQPCKDKPMTVVLLGDLLNGRTVHSLAKLLAQSGTLWWSRLTLKYCAPAGLELPEYIVDFCNSFPSVEQVHCSSLSEAIVGANVLYVTRVQRERFHSEEVYERVKGSYVVDKALLSQAPDDMIVMHPLPRVGEIARDVDSDPRAAYFRQMENGMFIRMALLALVLGVADK